MPRPTPAGPFKVLKSVDGQELPYYIIPFDAEGRCTGPLTKEHLVNAAAAGDYSDIFLFCHGWNNDWTAATKRYEEFIEGSQTLRRGRQLPTPAGYKPLLVGLFWPSQALSWFESETGPDMAAASNPAADLAAAATEHEVLSDVAESLPAEKRERFYALASAASVTQEEARELAGILAGALKADDEGARADAPSATDLLAAAKTLADANAEPDYDNVGGVGGAGGGGGGGGAAAAPNAAFSFGGLLGALDPRNLIKPFTVWQMKDRAGVVGRYGAAPLLYSLLSKSQARVHLLGHSYGCKVVMTALCSPVSLPRPVESALLFQPAVSQYAFAATVPSRGVPGGFREALKRTVRPIVATYSSKDVPLTKLFHNAVRRSDDLGELQFAAQGVTPSRYAAMGGFGPQDSNALDLAILDAGGEYNFGAAPGVVGINGTRRIDGHGDINHDATWWLSYLVSKA